MIDSQYVCNGRQHRGEALATLTPDSDVIAELLTYNENYFDLSSSAALDFPQEDEPFVEPWRSYAKLVQETESIESLSRYLIQLNFPIEAGISETPDYLQATRSGKWPSAPVGIQWDRPRDASVVILSTPAGHIPVVTLGSRTDFESMIRAVGRRNEPFPIPPSMGALMIANYTNWHRVKCMRERFEAEHGGDGNWSVEFARIKADKASYQDRFIILSTGPYSGIDAASLGLDHEKWLLISTAIRREHECAHYFTKRVFGSMRNNLLDEVLADYFGIVGSVGHFNAEWFLRFFGLENYPAFRDTGRLQNYRGTPALSDRAFATLQEILYRATVQLVKFDQACRQPGEDVSKTAALFAFGGMTMEELASDDASSRMTDAAKKWQVVYKERQRRVN